MTIAHQMQRIDFAKNPPTFYFGEPYNPLVFHFGSTYIPFWIHSRFTYNPPKPT
jgi:hypothetical protein